MSDFGQALSNAVDAHQRVMALVQGEAFDGLPDALTQRQSAIEALHRHLAGHEQEFAEFAKQVLLDDERVIPSFMAQKKAAGNDLLKQNRISQALQKYQRYT